MKMLSEIILNVTKLKFGQNDVLKSKVSAQLFFFVSFLPPRSSLKLISAEKLTLGRIIDALVDKAELFRTCTQSNR